MFYFRSVKRHDPKPYLDASITLRDGRRLGYAAFGDPSGRPVFWFHGTPGARQQLPPDAPRLARERGFRIIGVDRPGIGHSTPHRGRTLFTFADDVTELADRLNAPRFACIGLSGGGPYVLATSHRHPDRVVAGISLGGVGPTNGEEGAPGYIRLTKWLRAVAQVERPLADVLSLVVQPLRPLFSPVFELFVRFGPQEDRLVFETPEMKQMFAEDIVGATHQGLRAFVSDIAIFSRPWPFSVRQIRVPIRFYHGDADTIVPVSHSAHLAALVPNSRLKVLPGLGHFAGFCNTATLLDEIDALWPTP
ncbi:MAG: alpha/beta hydrolase [Myxococcales bacterium]|nr:alpha/beta hydrolase [Myxococcales bacterium]